MPAKEKIPIEGLLESYGAALTQTGYSITTKLLLVRRAELLIRRHLNAGLVYFYQAVINRYVSEIDALPSMLRGARQELTPKFEQIAEEFIAGDFHPNTRCDIRWVTYKYFAWLEGQGFRGITGYIFRSFFWLVQSRIRPALSIMCGCIYGNGFIRRQKTPGQAPNGEGVTTGHGAPLWDDATAVGYSSCDTCNASIKSTGVC